jgi:hypothetical protein
MDLAEINDVSVFTAHVGSVFRIEVGPEQFIDATLIEAEAITSRQQGAGSLPRQPFSLLFALPEGIDLAQETYNVSQQQLGELPLFLVPVGPSRMESVFN